MSAPAGIEISLVICTRNRADRLPRCLDAVSAMRASHPWELVVVDNGSTDVTPALLSEFAASAGFPVTIRTDPVPGLGRARNTGWRSACGGIIAFTDDDCYVATDYIDRIHDAFADDALGFCGGRITLFDPSDYPITIETSETRRDFPAGTYIDAGAIQGANMIFRRSVLEAIGGFDPDFGAGTPFSCEDVDAQARALFAGWAGAYVPEIAVAHHHGRKEADIPALMRFYFIGRGAYFTKSMLNRRARPMVLRHWYWEYRRFFRNRDHVWQRLLGDLEGTTRYSLLRLRRALSHR